MQHGANFPVFADNVEFHVTNDVEVTLSWHFEIQPSLKDHILLMFVQNKGCNELLRCVEVVFRIPEKPNELRVAVLDVSSRQFCPRNSVGKRFQNAKNY